MPSTIQRNTTLQPFRPQTALTNDDNTVTDPQRRYFTQLTAAVNAAPQIVSAAPAHSGAEGTLGDIAFDANFLYLCVAANEWRRVAISAF